MNDPAGWAAIVLTILFILVAGGLTIYVRNVRRKDDTFFDENERKKEP